MAARRKPVRPEPGSHRLLARVARLGISGLEPARLALGLSQATAYSHVARLSREGLLWRGRVGEYVIVHELLHLRVANHGPVF